MLNKLKNIFAKSKTETKETAKGPWVTVVEVHFDKDNPTKGYFELDWNDKFVDSLYESGYSGRNAEEVVDQWFNDLCRGVISDEFQEG